jgi:hypothetical protein
MPLPGEKENIEKLDWCYELSDNKIIGSAA